MTSSTDWWPEQSGRITDGLTIICNNEGTVTEGAAVKFGTSTASQIRVQNGAAVGDSWGVALKAASTVGEGVPICVFGLYKMPATTAITQGLYVMNTATPTIVATNTITAASLLAATSYILGMAMQTSTASSGTDNIVVFIGRGL